MSCCSRFALFADAMNALVIVLLLFSQNVICQQFKCGTAWLRGAYSATDLPSAAACANATARGIFAITGMFSLPRYSTRSRSKRPNA